MVALRTENNEYTRDNYQELVSRFDYETVGLGELEPITVKNAIQGVKIGNEAYFTSRRFLRTLMSIFGFSENLFQYFSPEELIGRILERRKDTEIRICIDRKTRLMQGIIRPEQSGLPLGIVCRTLVEDKRFSKMEYDPGSASIEAQLKLPDMWNIPSDSRYGTFLNIRYSVDEVSTPMISLGIVRQVCTNGMVARRRCFETALIVEKNHGTHLRQLLSSFNNRNGFDALRERLQIAQETKASVNEYMAAVGVVQRCIDHPEPVINRMDCLAGMPEEVYGHSRLDTIRARYRKELPVAASVMDLINILTELSTHYQVKNKDSIHTFITGMLASEFDLEEIVPNRKPARDFYMTGVSA